MPNPSPRPTMAAEPMLSSSSSSSTSSSSSSDEEEVVEWKVELECSVRDCACYWTRFGSPRTPRVAPGRDCFRIPAGAVHSPAWSLIVGVMDRAALRLSRLRVAQSGRILGRSDDELDFFDHIDMPSTGGQGFSASARASAALAPDGRSLCLLNHAYKEKPQALQLTLQPHTDDQLLPQHLPEIEDTSRCILISTGGQFWALSVLKHGLNFSVLMRRLVPGDKGWQQVGKSYTGPYKIRDVSSSLWGRWFLQGYAVLVLPLPDNAKEEELILVSFKQAGLFLTFAPDSGDWTLVPIDATRLRDYVPILGRAVYIEQDQAVYMLRDNNIFAYKLTYYQDDQGRRQLRRLDPPINIDTVCPFNSCVGYGFLARLDRRLMCSVWISLADSEPCPCDNLHAIVTTFHLPDPAQGGGIEVLHSSFRRVDMKPNPKDQEFCFLLEYEDKDSLVLLQHEEEQEDLTSSQHADDPSNMLDCCRRNLTPKNDPRMCFLCGVDGHIARDCSLPPQERSSAMVDPAPMRHQVSFPSRPVAPLKPATTTIKKRLFLICQIGSLPVICPTGVMDESLLLQGHNGMHLDWIYSADDGDGYWHFFCSGSKIHAVSSIRDDVLEFGLNMSKDGTLPTKRSVRRPPRADPFVLVIRVGEETIALTDTLQVYHQKVFTYGPTTTWLRCTTDQSHVLRRKVLISGYVEVNDHSFIVWDAVTCSCLLFDLGAKQWRVVMPWAAFDDALPRTNPTNCVLNGRCVFVDGFIYTCSYGGLAAHQLLHKDHSVYLSKSIFLPFPWLEYCGGEEMCLDYAGKDVESGTILFYVVQGGCHPPENDVQITIVKVKTKRTRSNKMRPVGVDLVDRITRCARSKSAFRTRGCFALSF